MAETTKQLTATVSDRGPANRLWTTCAVDNPLNPTDAEVKQYQNLLEKGARYVVTRRKIAESRILLGDGTIGRLELQEFGTGKLKRRWVDIKDKDIPYVCYNNEPNPAPSSPRTGPPESTYTHPGNKEFFKHPHLNKLSVHGGAPFGKINGQAGKGRVYFYKVGFNKIKPTAHLDAETHSTNYPDFKPLQKGDGVVLVGMRSKNAIVNIDGTDVNSYIPIVIKAHADTTWIKAHQTSSKDEINKFEHLQEAPSSSSTLIDLNVDDMVVKVKKLKKKSNFNIESPTGCTGIRG